MSICANDVEADDSKKSKN